MLPNQVSKLLTLIIVWALVGALCWLSYSKPKPIPGKDFPVPDSTKGIPLGWDFEKQEYKYHIPNPKTMDKVYPVKNPKVNIKGEPDPYEALYYYLD